MNFEDFRRRAREAAERVAQSAPARAVLDNPGVRSAVDAAGETVRAVREEVGRAGQTVQTLVAESAVDDLAELKARLARLKDEYRSSRDENGDAVS